MQIVFAITLLVSSALLFWIQPMFSKMVLPMLGGVPAVWNTCLVLYQATLLLGYFYVHFTSKKLRMRRQIMFHLILIWAAVFAMSFEFEQIPLLQNHPVSWVFQVFWRSIGVPFLMLSATTPMLQSWFSHSPHRRADNPYMFYAVSNAGSFAALLSYPLFIEPYLRLHTQQTSWMIGYGLLATLLSGCAIWMFRIRTAAPSLPETSASETISMSQRLRWVLFACIPASLLLGVTNYITTDIASVPLFWVVPLCLYLLTFVLVFARTQLLRHQWMLNAQTYLAAPLLLICIGELRTNLWLDFPLHLVAFFVFAMVCHGELAKSKPSSRRVTEFNVCMAVGGVLGGIFTALIAPLIFRTIFEYPLMIALSCLIRPAQPSTISRTHLRWLLASVFAALAMLSIGLATRDRSLIFLLGIVSLLLMTSMGGAFCFQLLNTPKRLAFGMGSFLLAGMLLMNTQQHVILRQRGFFGTLKVAASPDEKFHLFYHGTTLHGSQQTASNYRNEPLTYFHRTSPLGQLFANFERQPPRSVAVFGLGIGTMAAYTRTNDAMTFYEIDPNVEAVARNTQWFHYLQDAAGQIRVVIGDARVAFANAPDQAYDMIIQDAFSSDMIPAHLLTREAFRLYQRKLTADGVLIFNITNRYLDLEPVLANLISDSGMIGVIQRDNAVRNEDLPLRKCPSVWVVSAQHAEDLRELQNDSRWQPMRNRGGARLWTDDYSNIVSMIKFPQKY